MKWLLMPLGLGAVAFANAQLVWDNTPMGADSTYRSPDLTPALQITNTNSFALDLVNVAFECRNSYGQMFDFFLADASGNRVADTQTFEAANGQGGLLGTTVNWVLSPGASYYIGAAASTSSLYENYEYPQFHFENGLQSQVNGNFTGYGSTLQFSYNGSGDMSWLLVGLPPASPEPASLLALGGLLPIVLRRRVSREVRRQQQEV